MTKIKKVSRKGLVEKIDVIIARSLDEDFQGDYDLKTALQIIEQYDGKKDIEESLDDHDLELLEDEGLLTEHDGAMWMSKMGEEVLKDLSKNDPQGEKGIKIWQQ